eukprot:4516672-Amphidinium_carterae.1
MGKRVEKHWEKNELLAETRSFCVGGLAGLRLNLALPRGTEPPEVPESGLEEAVLKPALDDASASTTTPDDDSVSKTASQGESPVCEQQVAF